METVAAAMKGLDIKSDAPSPHSSDAFGDLLGGTVAQGGVPKRVIEDKFAPCLMMLETKVLGGETRSNGAFHRTEHEQAAQSNTDGRVRSRAFSIVADRSAGYVHRSL
jgi:hypothetical protein